MHDELTRRHLLGVSGAIAVGGCLDADGSSESDDEQRAEPTGDGGETEGSDEAESDGAEENEGDEDDGDDGEEADEATDETVHESYETTEVSAVTPDGDELGSVTAAIADTDELRHLGLSDTADLPSDRGMLFVYESVEERAFVMREMDFGIDIVYADDEGVITGIHHAPAPDPGEDGEEPEHRYPGRGQYVLEVVYEWTVDHGVSEGDRLEFDLESESESDA